MDIEVPVLNSFFGEALIPVEGSGRWRRRKIYRPTMPSGPLLWDRDALPSFCFTITFPENRPGHHPFTMINYLCFPFTQRERIEPFFD
jgi:hypothetical protein